MVLTRNVKDLIDKSPEKATNVHDALYSTLSSDSKSLYEIPDDAPDDVAYHTDFIKDFKFVSWYYKTLVKAEDITPGMVDTVVIGALAYGIPTTWNLAVNGKQAETLDNIDLTEVRENVFSVKSMFAQRPLHLGLVKSFELESDSEVYLFVAKISPDCSEKILSLDNVWLFTDTTDHPAKLSDVVGLVESISFKSNSEVTSLKISNSTVVNIPRKLFINDDGIQTWVINDSPSGPEGAFIEPRGLSFDPEPDEIVEVKTKRVFRL